VADEASETNPIAALLEVLDLADSDARTSEDIFTGVSQFMPLGRVYGGQVLAQTIIAAARTLPADRVVHSMHGYFLRPATRTRASPSRSTASTTDARSRPAARRRTRTACRSSR